VFCQYAQQNVSPTNIAYNQAITNDELAIFIDKKCLRPGQTRYVAAVLASYFMNELAICITVFKYFCLTRANRNMKISKEVRIGILATLSILIFFVGYNFLKNATVFSNDKEYYCFYKDIGGLQNSAVVQIMGLNVGHVAGLELVQGRGVKVTIAVGKNIDVPAGTVARLESSLLGSPSITLEQGPGPGAQPTGTELKAEIEGGVMDNVSSELTPRLKELKTTIRSFDTTLAGVNAIVSAENQHQITEVIKSLKVTADNLAALSGALKDESGEIKSVVHNANSITGNLARSNDTVTQLLSHINSLTRQLNNAPIQKTFDELHEASASLKRVMEKIDKGEGSLGLLVNDKDLYNNLKTALSTLNKLMADLNAHPSRYVNISLIGGKKKD
jgi:phospholipid/cholesterol/gamma-HCH transport system substrate-binding protein